MHSLANLNTYSGNSVTYTDQTLGPNQVLANRYQINGLLDTNSSVIENLETLCSTAGSWLSYDVHTGKWAVVINKAESSVASFDDSNILSDITVSGTGLTDLYNSVRVELPNRDINDSSDFISVEIPDIDRNPNEPDNVLNLSYEVLNEPIQAEILGFIELKQSRVDKVISFNVDYSYIGLNAGDVISVTNAQFGFSNKLFRIISISEIQDNAGPLFLEITALEYDADVYDESNLYRYTRTNNTGIITIGSIGQPGNVTVTKYELDARPRLEISTTSPSGIVSGMEFWLTTDTTEPDDNNRSYVLIGVEKPSGGGTYSSGTTVTLDYQNLQAGNVYVKARGFNATNVGPFSNVSGLVEFTPTQITDAVNPNTAVLGSSGGILTALALTELLTRLDGLWGPFANAIGGNSIFEQIFDLFKEDTGYDLVGQTKSGNLVVAANVNILDEGNVISTAANSLNFVGNAVVATASGNDITITIDGGVSEEEVSDSIVNSVAGISTNSYDMGMKWEGDPNLYPPDANVLGAYYHYFGTTQGSGPPVSVYPGLWDTRCGIITCSSLTAGTGTAAPYVVREISPGNTTFQLSFSGSINDLALPPDRDKWLLTSKAGNTLTWTRQFTNNNAAYTRPPSTTHYPKLLFFNSIAKTYNTSANISSQSWGPWKVIGDGNYKAAGGRPDPEVYCGNGAPASGNLYTPPGPNDPSTTGNKTFADSIATFTVNVPNNAAIIFGLSVLHAGQTDFAGNTIFRTGPDSVAGNVVFPGYTATTSPTVYSGVYTAAIYDRKYNISGNTWTWTNNGDDSAYASLYGNLTANVSIWPDTIQGNTNLLDKFMIISGYAAGLQPITSTRADIFNAPIYSVKVIGK